MKEFLGILGMEINIKVSIVKRFLKEKKKFKEGRNKKKCWIWFGDDI